MYFKYIIFYLHTNIDVIFSACIMKRTSHELKTIKYGWCQYDNKYIHKRIHYYVHVVLFFGNILQNLLVVYLATLAEVPCLDLAFSCKIIRSWYFWYCSSFFVRWICLNHRDTGSRVNSYSSIGPCPLLKNHSFRLSDF